MNAHYIYYVQINQLSYDVKYNLLLANQKISQIKNLVPPGLEPGTFRVLGERDNHYTTELLPVIQPSLLP